MYKIHPIIATFEYLHVVHVQLAPLVLWIKSELARTLIVLMFIMALIRFIVLVFSPFLCTRMLYCIFPDDTKMQTSQVNPILSSD